MTTIESRKMHNGRIASQYQEHIFQAIESTNDNIAIKAVAGSGKTTSLIEACSLLKGRNIFLAFNKNIAEDIQAKIERYGWKASTIHSLGFAIIRSMFNGRIKVFNNKSNFYINKVLDSESLEKQEKSAYRKAMKKLFSSLRTELMGTDSPLTDNDINILVERYNIDIPCSTSTIRKLLQKTLELHKKDTRQIDFDDMISFMFYHKSKIVIPSYDNILVDECQDLSTAQIELVKLFKGSRIIAVGDPRQSIYAFRGADYRSFEKLVESISATTYPLSVSYRCGKSIVSLAQSIVPDIEAYEKSPEGNVLFSSDNEILFQTVQPSDFIICRTNAPLFRLAMYFFSRHIPCKIKGRDIAQTIIEMIEYIEENIEYSTIQEGITNWYELKKQMVMEAEISDRQKDKQIEYYADISECLSILAEDCPDFNCCKRKIEALFSDSDESCYIWLSTIHKVKGLEAKNVFIINAELMPHPKAETEEERQQEYNMMYVAYTRAIETLTIIQNEKGKRGVQE